MVHLQLETQAQALQRISNATTLIRRGRAIRPRLKFERGQEDNLRFFSIEKVKETEAPPAREVRPTRPVRATREEN